MSCLTHDCYCGYRTRAIKHCGVCGAKARYGSKSDPLCASCYDYAKSETARIKSLRAIKRRYLEWEDFKKECRRAIEDDEVTEEDILAFQTVAKQLELVRDRIPQVAGNKRGLSGLLQGD